MDDEGKTSQSPIFWCEAINTNLNFCDKVSKDCVNPRGMLAYLCYQTDFNQALNNLFMLSKWDKTHAAESFRLVYII